MGRKKGRVRNACNAAVQTWPGAQSTPAQQQQGLLQKLGARVNSFSATLVSSILSLFYLSPTGRNQSVNSEQTDWDITTVGKETNAK